MTKRGRGRPRGSKNKSIVIGTTEVQLNNVKIRRTYKKRIPKSKQNQNGSDLDDDDVMDQFGKVSRAFVECPERQSDSDDSEEDNELLDPDDEVMKKDKAKKGRRGRKRKGPSIITPAEAFSLALCPFPLPRDDFALPPYRRAKKREFTEDIDNTEDTSGIFALFQKRKSLKLGRDYDAIITSRLQSIKTSTWFDKRMQNALLYTTYPKIFPQLPSVESYNLMNIMWAFHTNWIVNKTAEHRAKRLEVVGSDADLEVDLTSETKSDEKFVPCNINMDWIQTFLYYFRVHCKNVLAKGSGRIASNLKTMLDMCISLVVDVSAKEMTKMSLCHFNAFKGVSNWSETINRAIAQKDNLLEKMEIEHQRVMCIDSKLDEGSIWGLKPLRRCLAPPYYKTADGLTAGPVHPAATKQAEVCPFAFFNFNKQKWTTKDLEALKIVIREVLIEKNMLLTQMITDVLLKDCADMRDQIIEEKLMREARGEPVEEDETPKRRRGRPKKFGQSAFVGTISPLLFTLQFPFGQFEVRQKISNIHIEEWKDSEDDKINKFELPDLLKLNSPDKIDWLTVSNKTTLKTKKNRSPDDCWLAFNHEANPKIQTMRWSAVESAHFQTLVKQYTTESCKHNGAIRIDWELLNHKMGNHRTPFQLFYRWRNNITHPKKTVWKSDRSDDLRVNELIKRNEGNWKKVAIQCGNELATKKQIIDRYKKNSNAALRAGSFTRVEDALLLLAIEKLKGHLGREGHFGELIAYLPWRFETVWRDRAGNLFSDWIVPWKIEEDKQLLELAKTKKGNWREIADSFSSFKNRKGCLTRWKILQKRLKTFETIEEYHEAYSMIRYNVFQYKHLRELLELLKKIIIEPKVNFKGFYYGSPPEESDLQDFLLSFDRTIVGLAINSLQEYIKGRDEFWKKELQTKRKRTFDRRTFHKENPQSVASALHIRGIHLVPKTKLKLNEFEEDVYKFYARFSRTKALNPKTKRLYLPTEEKLRKIKKVKRIILAVEPNVC